MNKAHVTHPELKATFSLAILGVKKNPNGAMYSSLGVITKGEGLAGGFVIILLPYVLVEGPMRWDCPWLCAGLGLSS